MRNLLTRRDSALGLCCHPYNFCPALIAKDASVILGGPSGGPVYAPLALKSEVSWAGYAKAALARRTGPVLARILRQRGHRA